MSAAVRIAAIGDLHFGADTRGILRPRLDGLADVADVLLVAGDLTRVGRVDEARAIADELAGLDLPVVCVLGNHDLHSDEEDGVVACLEASGLRVLRRESVVLDVAGARLGIAGVKGFGVGFPGASCSDFGEPVTRAFFGHARDEACALEQLLAGMADTTDVRVALMHYAPVVETLVGEPNGIWPFLGSYLLAEAVDRGGAHLAVHGHAHRGSERGETPGGVPVRNVAWPVVNAPYRVYELAGARQAARR